MIIDKLENAKTYKNLHPGVADAIKFLQTTDLFSLAEGMHNINGRAFAMVSDYETVTHDEKSWEAHKRYIDVQYIVSGTESFGYNSVDNLKTIDKYVTKEDIYHLEGDGTFFNAAAGTMIILFPQDAHMPSLQIDNKPSKIRKVVVKVIK